MLTHVRLSGESGWLRFDDVDFRAGIGGFEARCSSAKRGGRIELRLDAADGPLIGECTVSETEGSQVWETFACKTIGVQQTHSVYLCLIGDISLSRFRFTV
ncbi:carbohydrate-binding protein [Paenibacillus sp. Soil522]|uniref:carbohydrate-binding protein n=1 Tax=Paenibacillus sp. Soil522 TaxID=1736388 RepID=UPI0007019474|nr:carbohydrate-binding protein [Paenibacillus sp. Soil522]KRE46169.1 hypothetical protein ASG81_12275 [Paenibacillus sp. Soil522]